MYGPFIVCFSRPLTREKEEVEMRNRVIIGVSLAAIVMLAYLWMAKRDSPPAPTLKPAVEQPQKPTEPIKAESARVQVAEKSTSSDNEVEGRLNKWGLTMRSLSPIKVQ